MYYIESDLDRKKYLSELRRSFRNPFLIFDERVCGIVVGPIFSVSYHSPYEWNRRITSECNRAWGYVRERNGKTEIHFLVGKGLLSPFWLIFYFLFSLGIFAFAIFQNGYILESSSDYSVILICCAVMSLIACVISAIQSSLTEQGIEGQNILVFLLQKPEEYYG